MSGGWKRKVSFAIAILGNPKIIIMDEPTSGMDRITRKLFWELIETLKQEKKTVIYTTQFLDEAESLSDRIAVMSKGKLFAFGSVDYIKKKFSVGYSLILYNRNNPAVLQHQSEEITRKIQSFFPSLNCHNDTNLNVLKYILPFGEQKKFSQLFLNLEKQRDIKINLHSQTLEEAFQSLKMKRIRFNNDQNKIRLSFHQEIPSEFLSSVKEASFLSQTLSVILQRVYTLKGNKIPLLILLTSTILNFLLSQSSQGHVFLARLPEIFISKYDPFMMILGTNFLSCDNAHDILFTQKVMGLKSLSFHFGNLIIDLVLKLPSIIFLMFYFKHLEEASPSQLPYRRNKDLYLTFLLISTFQILTYYYMLCFKFKKDKLNKIILVLLIACSSNFGPDFDTLENNYRDYILYFLVSFLIPITPLISFAKLSNRHPDFAFGAKFLSFQRCLLIYTAAAGFGGIINFLILLYQSSKLFNLNNKKKNDFEARASNSTILDETTVNYEKRRLTTNFNRDVIKSVNVQKVFPNRFKAIYDLSFGVEKSQIFCILGPNGAGKSTTFDILTQKIPITSGYIEKRKRNIKIGVCFQQNALWDDLSVQEHFHIYVLMKGLSFKKAKISMEYLLDVLSLKPYKKKKVKELSEGTKRKLSVALCVLGAPDLILLDEPTTGVDPIGRNQIWSLLKTLVKKKGCSVIMSTHYMEDAELIADKIGIMVNGSFATIGVLTELRKKYEDYLIVIDGVVEGYLRELEKVIKTMFPKAILDPNPELPGTLFRVPFRAMRFSKAFLELEKLKSRQKIKDFSIFTTNLEQIFIRLARKQVQETLEAPNEIDRSQENPLQ